MAHDADTERDATEAAEVGPAAAVADGPGAVPVDEESARAARRMSRRAALLWMLAVLALMAVVRLPLFAFPMGQTAGTVAYVGRRWIAHQIVEVPYRDMWDYEAPGTYLMAGLAVRLLGPSAVRCRLAMMAIDLGTVLLVYYFVRQWCNRTEAVVAAGLCGFFGGAIFVQGDCLGAERPLAFLLVLSMVAALHSKGRRWTWVALSGLAVGLAVCFRPIAWLYVVALMVWLVATNGGSKSRLMRWVVRPGVLLAFAAVPVALVVLYFWWAGAFEDFWRNLVVHTWRYRMPVFTRQYIARNLRVAWVLAPEQVALWLFAGGWAIHAFSMGFRRETGLVALWGVVAVVAAMGARRVDTVHFHQVVPPFAIGAALAMTNPSERFFKRDERGRLATTSALLGAFAVALFLGFLYTERKAYLERSSRVEVNTDKAAVEVATLIRRRTTWRDKIYVWGTRPQIYVIAKRGAAHPAFYNRELNIDRLYRDEASRFFDPSVYQEIFRTLEREQPPFVVTTEQYVAEEIEKLGPIAPWFYYMREHYDLWKIVDATPYSFTIFARKDRVYDE